MTDAVQLVIVTTVAAGAFAALARPLWRKRAAPPAAPTAPCEKCGPK